MEPAQDLPEWTRRAVFLYGPRKSGTTLLLNLLDGGDELLCFPAGVSLNRLFAERWTGGDDFHDAFYRLSDIVDRRFPNFDDAAYRARVEAAASDFPDNLRDALRRDVLELYRSIETPPSRVARWVLKEGGGATPVLVQLFRSLFFEGRVVLIVRDPRMVTRAVVLDRRRRGRRLSWRDLMLEAVEPRWVLAHQVRLVGDPDTHVVAYEDLVADPARELRAIAAHLDIDYHPAFERPTIFGQPVVVSTSSRDVSAVFRAETRWFDGLTLRERVVIRVTWALTPLYLAMRRLSRVDEKDLRRGGALRSRLDESRAAPHP